MILRSLLIVASPYHMTLLLALSHFRAPLLFQTLYVSNIHVKHVAQ